MEVLEAEERKQIHKDPSGTGMWCCPCLHSDNNTMSTHANLVPSVPMRCVRALRPIWGELGCGSRPHLLPGELPKFGVAQILAEVGAGRGDLPSYL